MMRMLPPLPPSHPPFHQPLPSSPSSPASLFATLKEHHIYLLKSGRISMACPRMFP